jgi:beta-glucosidase
MKLFKPFPSFVAGLVAASACTLPPPVDSDPTGSLSGGICLDDVDGGTPMMGSTDGGTSDDGGGDDGGPDAGSNIDYVVTPVSCQGSGTGNPNAIDKYSQGYTADPANLKRVDDTIKIMKVADEIAQMVGTPYGSGASQFTDIQRSLDTSTIRGFRYRDASRGMNLGEDMMGAKPNAGKADNTTVGYSTAFPVSMARGAAFDLDLEYAIGEAIGDEMQAAKETLLLAPCMNLLRHPYWGRAQETYGEDPFEIGRLASAMVVGVQQHILANAKHFMAYDVENQRALNDTSMDEQTLRETYGRHFRMVVQDGGVGSVMASYNLVNKTKSTQNFHTLTEVLRNDFGFKGFILSDWWAMPNGTNANTDPSILKSTAVAALNAGLDVELPWALNYGQLQNLYNTGVIQKGAIDAAARRILEQKFRFQSDPLNGPVGITSSTRTHYSRSAISCDLTHIDLAEKAALESMVLLKNNASTLPISAAVSTVAVVGADVPYATNAGSLNTGGLIHFATDVRTGDQGSSRVFIDPKKGIGPAAGIQLTAPPGVHVVSGNSADAAAHADFVVVIVGLTPQDEGEEYTGAGDRSSLALDAKQKDGTPAKTAQNDLVKAVAALGKPMVVVIEGGAVIDMSQWLDSVPAVVMAWYPGMVGGKALGELLWGTYNGKNYNFSGKLPVTWAKNANDYDIFNPNAGTASGGSTNPVPTHFDYFAGYRWFDNKGITPLYPFGYGLSYTKFEYRKLQLGCTDMAQGAVLPVVVNVANTGNVDGTEIVMVFVSFPDTTARRPVKELKAFMRVDLKAGEEKQVSIPVRLSDLDYFQTDSTDPHAGKWVVESGRVQISVGGSSTNFTLPVQTVTVKGY